MLLKKKTQKSVPSTLGRKQNPAYLFSNSKDDFSSPQGTKSGHALYKSKPVKMLILFVVLRYFIHKQNYSPLHFKAPRPPEEEVAKRNQAEQTLGNLTATWKENSCSPLNFILHPEITKDKLHYIKEQSKKTPYNHETSQDKISYTTVSLTGKRVWEIKIEIF